MKACIFGLGLLVGEAYWKMAWKAVLRGWSLKSERSVPESSPLKPLTRIKFYLQL